MRTSESMDEKIEVLKEQFKDLNWKFEELQSEVKELKQQLEPKQEKFYQSFLEKEVGGCHKVNKYGITDVTTETMHIEIKPWRLYKHCLGQLQAYNHMDNKQLIAALYGNVHKKKDLIIKLFQDNNIQVWELHDVKGRVQIIKHQFENDIENWLNNNVYKSMGSILELKDVCSVYSSREMNKREKGFLRKNIEHWIQKAFPNINYKCQESRMNNVKYFGWKGLGLQKPQ